MEGDVRGMARAARTASTKLRVFPKIQRVSVLEHFASLIESSLVAILAANDIDMKNASGNIPDALMKRLKLTEAKLSSAVSGIRQIARSDNPIGQILSRTQIMKNLILEKVSVPIGVLLVIFEARPECLIQIVALAIWSGNGLLLKGGKEAKESNYILHKLVCEAIAETIPSVGYGLIGLIHTHEEIASLLKLDDVIDLVIPRGSNQLVSYVKQNTKIAVLGHADGICHVYIDSEANLKMACDVCRDSKIDYPSACNAVEKILFHKETLRNDIYQTIISELKLNGVKLHKGEHSSLSVLKCEKAPSKSHEYSSLDVTIEVVDSLEEAIEHINEFGSHHTDAIVTSNAARAHEFLCGVDSASVYCNTSTRWADGYRYGLGAEVGISTSRIHARGPVGVEGLMTTKFIMCGTGHVVAGDAKKNEYQFKKLPIKDQPKASGIVYGVAGLVSAAVVALLYTIMKSQYGK